MKHASYRYQFDVYESLKEMFSPTIRVLKENAIVLKQRKEDLFKMAKETVLQ